MRPIKDKTKEVKRTCKTCRKKFSIYAHRAKAGHGTYCSKYCQYNDRSKQVEKICKRCGKKFSIHQSQAKVGEGVYCSMECHFPKREKVTCICGQQFDPKPSLTKNGGGLYCSKKCFHANKRRKPPEERFWKQVKKGDGCWIWTAARNNKGYGRFGVIPGKGIQAHRYSFELHKGEIKDGLFVLHKCDNPACVNPDHLFVGTNQDNRDDMCNKGRQSSKLTKMNKEKILKIRSLNGKMNNTKIAAKFGTTKEYIGEIMRRKVWKHI